MLDLYCERTGPGLWAEPMNVLTNGAYLLAAWAVWHAARPAGSVEARTSAVLIAAIGIGSALFHLTATPGARLLDELPILAFEAAFLWWYGRRLAGLSRSATAALVVGLVAAILSARTREDLLNGSFAYVPPLVTAVGLAVYHARTQARDRFALPIGAALLMAALVLRTLDQALCAAFPAGTHFLWHLLTAAALYLFARGLIANLG